MKADMERRVPSVLVVDDTPANLSLLCGMLKERGYRVRPVPSGDLALDAAWSDPPDLVLLDISMPEMDGFEVCRRLKADPRSAEIPVVFLTAHTEPTEKVKAFALGGVDYVTKPFQIEEVHARVATHIELSFQKRELKESYDRLRELEELRDSLVHMVVHDLTSPLTTLDALLEILRRTEADRLSERARTALQHCLGAVDTMKSMVGSVLDVSKMEAGAMKLSPQVCDLAEIGRGLLLAMRGIVGDRRIVLDVEGAAPVTADADLVTRIIQNLLGNALKFTPREGEIRIRIRADDDALRFSVADTGPGVPKEFQQKIFEKFGQVEAHSGGQRKSTGLGLTFCKLAVEAHGGRIGVESDGKHGSTFWFTLPRS
jgi:two-component system, sensor histidine kinase and response regulator